MGKYTRQRVYRRQKGQITRRNRLNNTISTSPPPQTPPLEQQTTATSPLPLFVQSVAVQTENVIATASTSTSVVTFTSVSSIAEERPWTVRALNIVSEIIEMYEARETELVLFQEELLEFQEDLVDRYHQQHQQNQQFQQQQQQQQQLQEEISRLGEYSASLGARNNLLQEELEQVKLHKQRYEGVRTKFKDAMRRTEEIVEEMRGRLVNNLNKIAQLDYDKKALALNLNYERVEVARLRDEVMRLKREIELSERIRNHLANQ